MRFHKATVFESNPILPTSQVRRNEREQWSLEVYCQPGSSCPSESRSLKIAAARFIVRKPEQAQPR
jgi:hypothetical protein